MTKHATHAVKKKRKKKPLIKDLTCRIRPQNTSAEVDCKTVVFFANASDGPYSYERSGASLKAARENGDRHTLRACEARALPAFRKRPKTTVLQSTSEVMVGYGTIRFKR